METDIAAIGPHQSRLQGFADKTDRYGVAGWAFDPDRPDAWDVR